MIQALSLPSSPTVADDVERIYAQLLAYDAGRDPATRAWHEQVVNHLRHVRYDFRTDGAGYPHEHVLPGPYADAPSKLALRRAREFLAACSADDVPVLSFPRLRSETVIRQEQKELVARIVADPLAYYQQARARLEAFGENAAFPEWSGVAEYLISRMQSDEKIAGLLRVNNVMRSFAAVVVLALVRACVDDDAGPAFGYRKMIDAIEDGVRFYDVVWRVLDPEDSPPLYHSRRYEYYMHYLSAAVPRHIFLPTITNLGVTDLLAVRGVPIGFIGVCTKIERVDGFLQTPYEFFMHDVNHSRRMYQFAVEEAERQGRDDAVFFARTNAYMRDKIMPLFVPSRDDGAEGIARKKVVKMLLFEILHEDALPADPGVILNALLRPPMQLTPFEKIDGDTVIYIMEPGATTLSYVYRKLAHTFYDAPENRKAYIVDDAQRQRQAVLLAGRYVIEKLALGPVSAQTLAQLAYSDDGFPDDFRREVEADIERRCLDKLGAEQGMIESS